MQTCPRLTGAQPFQRCLFCAWSIGLWTFRSWFLPTITLKLLFLILFAIFVFTGKASLAFWRLYRTETGTFACFLPELRLSYLWGLHFVGDLLHTKRNSINSYREFLCFGIRPPLKVFWFLSDFCVMKRIEALDFVRAGGGDALNE